MNPADDSFESVMGMNFGEQLPELSIVQPELKPLSGLAHAVLRIPVSVQVVIGTVKLPLSEVTQLAPGATVALEEKLGAPSKVLVNGREVAEGELFVIDTNNGRLGLTITKITGNDPAD